MAKEKPTLMLHGSQLSLSRVPKVIIRVKKFLDDLPDHQAFSTDALAEKLGYSVTYLQSKMKYLGDKYRYLDGIAYGYGNTETVKLKKEGFYDRPEESIS